MKEKLLDKLDLIEIYLSRGPEYKDRVSELVTQAKAMVTSMEEQERK